MTVKQVVAKKTAPVEPVLAATYKFCRWADEVLERERAWEVLGKVRYMLGQKPMQMDGVTYGEMRSFIKDFMNRRLGL